MKQNNNVPLILPMTIVGLLLLIAAASAKICRSIEDPNPRISFELTPKNQSVDFGASVELECNIFSIPGATVYWKKGGRLLETIDTVEYEHIANAKIAKVISVNTIMTKLIIPCVGIDSFGEYTCIADNGCKQIEAKAAILPAKKVHIFGQKCPTTDQAPKINGWTDTRLERSDISAQLVCRAVGHPKPTIHWYRIDEDDVQTPIVDEIQLQNGDLIVPANMPISSNNPSALFYQCVAKNTHGIDSKVIMLFQTIPTK